MAFIGNTVQTQGFTPAIDYFNGNGVTVTFTLSRPVVSVAQMIVAIDNVIQNPSSAFSVSGNSITFTSAPLSGTNNIWVEYTSLITSYAAISQDPSVIGDITATGGFLAEGDFGNTYIDGTIVDYVTGNARITTGPADGLTIYNGGTTARTALAAWSTTGALTNTGDGIFNGVTVGKGVGSVSTNTALGVGVLSTSSAGSTNTGVGYNALSAASITGTNNTAVGSRSLASVVSGASNVGVGASALYNNNASNNTAVGYQAGYSDTTAYNNTVLGYRAGYTNSTASYNTFVGTQAGYSFNTTGETQNCFVGNQSGYSVTTGTKNTILGSYNGNQGGVDIRTASNHIVISDGDGNPKIWMNSSSVLYVPGVYSNTSVNAANVVSYGSNGDLYRSTSSARYKTEITDSTRTLADFLKLRPVTYKNINPNIDNGQTFGGLIAEEVHEAGLTEFVVYNEEGTPESLAYGNMIGLAVKAIQEQQAIITSLTARIEALESK
jgi:hypothetical protein